MAAFFFVWWNESAQRSTSNTQPIPKHTGTSQPPPLIHNQELFKKSPRGVQRGRGFAAPLRFFAQKKLPHLKDVRAEFTGWRRIRTFEGGANRFTVCPLWPLGNPSVTTNMIIYKIFYICKLFLQKNKKYHNLSIFGKVLDLPKKICYYENGWL